MNKAKHRRKSAGIATSRGYNSTIPHDYRVPELKRSVFAKLRDFFGYSTLETAIESAQKAQEGSDQPKTASQPVDSEGPKVAENAVVVG